MTPKSIGFVLRRKDDQNAYGGAGRCKVYSSYKVALAAVRGYKQTDADVLKRYDVVEAFVFD